MIAYSIQFVVTFIAVVMGGSIGGICGIAIAEIYWNYREKRRSRK